MAYGKNLIPPHIPPPCGIMTSEPAKRLLNRHSKRNANSVVFSLLKPLYFFSLYLSKLSFILLTAAFLLLAQTTYSQNPVVAGTKSSASTSNTTTHYVELPGGIQAGDLMIILWADRDTYSTAIIPSGWTTLYNATYGSFRYFTIYKIADGSEDTTQVIYTTLPERSAHNSYKIAANTYGGMPVALVDVSPVVSPFPDPPYLSSGFGNVEILWIAAAHSFGDDNDPLPQPPSGYTDLITGYTGNSGSSHARMTSARRHLIEPNTDPGNFTLGSSVRWSASTIAIQSACTDATLNLTSGAGTDNQFICFNDPVQEITYAIGGDASGATVNGLPAGVTGTFNTGTFTISGTPTETGTFNYLVITTGTPPPCEEDSASGTIIVNSLPSTGITPDPANLCTDASLNMNGNPVGGSGTYSSHQWEGPGAFYLSATNIVDPVFSGAPPGTYSLTYSVTDNNGCGSSDNILVTVFDTPACNITGPDGPLCPGTAELYSAPAGMASYLWSISGNGSLSGSTTSQTVTVISGGDCDASFTLTVSIIDNNGCSGTCNKIVNVNDDQDPTISCVGDQTRNTNAGSCDYLVSGTEFDPLSFGDNCTGATISNDYNNLATLDGAVFPSGITTVTWTVADICGNIEVCSFAVEIEDTEDPQITCPSPANPYAADSGICHSTQTFSASATDNCGVASIVYTIGGNPISFPYNFQVGTTTVIAIATDLSGNTEECSFDVVVEDNQDPQVSCPVPANPYPTDAGQCYTALTFSASATDNCGVASIVYTIGGNPISFPYIFPVGTTAVTVIATDLSGNTDECSFNVNVEDNQDPQITCPEDIIATGNEACTGTVIVDDPEFSDNCTIQSLTWNMTGATTNSSPLTGINLIGTYTFNPGVTNILYEVTDNSGNTSNCTFTVEVPFPLLADVNSNSPVCEGDTLELTSSVTGGVPAYDYSWTGPNGFSSNIQNPTIPDIVPAGSGDYILTITDINDCQTTATTTVTIYQLPNVTANPVSQEVCHDFASTSIIFNSNVPGAVFNWTNNTPSIGLPANGSGNIPSFTAINIGTDPVTATITVIAAANGCEGAETLIIITVNPIPTLSSNIDPKETCSGEPFFYHPTSETAGTEFTWSRAFVPGITPNTGSGTGDISEILVNNTNIPRIVHYLIYLTANGCDNPDPYDLEVEVNPVPDFTSSVNPPGICSGSLFNYTPASNVSGANFSWSRAAVPGIQEPASSGTGDINEILTNTTPLPVSVTYEYIVSFEGCVNPETFLVQVPVKPIPVLTSNLYPPGICSGNVFNYIPASNTPGTIFNWSRPGVPGIQEPPATGQGNPNEILTNTTSDPISVVYIYTLTASGCSNPDSFNVSVIVSPQPILTSSQTPPGICSGTIFSYDPQSNVSNTTFEWVRASIPGILPLGTSGSGNPTEILTNTTSLPISVRYVYTLSAGACQNPQPFNVDVIVNPIPVLSSSLNPPDICSGEEFLYSPTSNTPGTSFEWNRAAVAGISNPPANGTGEIGETLNNTTNVTIDVAYEYTLTATGCGNTELVVVGVKPTPTVDTIDNQVWCAGESVPTTNLSGPVAGTTFAWSNDNTSIGLGASGTGNIPGFTAINSTDNPIIANISITPIADSCTGPVFSYSIAVYPSPVLTSTTSPDSICSGSEFSYEPTSNVDSTTFLWSRAAVSGILNPAASGTGNPQEILINTTVLPVDVTYVYTLTANGCASPSTYNVVVTVKPVPVLTSTVSPQPICSNSVFSYSPTSGTPGTIFNWSRAIVPGISNPAASGTGNPDEILINDTIIPINVIYEYTLVADGCSNIQNVIVTVFPTPTVDTIQDQAFCHGDIVPETIISGPVSGTSFSWTNSNPAIGLAGTGNGNIPSFTATNTTSDPIVATITILPEANNCSGTPYSYTITVYPSATVTPVEDQVHCQGDTVQEVILTGPIPGTSFSWINSNPAIGLPAGGSGNISSFIATNPGIVPVTAIITITPAYGSCPGVPISYTITVNPSPSVDPVEDQTYCEGSIVPETILSGNIPGTEYYWTNDNPGIGLSANGIGNIPAFTAVNDAPEPIIATVTIIPIANNCTGDPEYYTITVNPIPELSSSLDPPAVCSGSQFYYVATSLTSNVVFSWHRPVVPGISNPEGSGNDTIDEYLINTTYDPIMVTYEVTLVANGCSIIQNVSVEVLPIPIMTSTQPEPTVCSYSLFVYEPSGPVNGTIFSWSRAAVPGIQNPPASGTGNISETLINTTEDPVPVTYVYSMTASGCSNPTPENITVVVIPAPEVTASASATEICTGDLFDLFSSSNLGSSLPSILLQEGFNSATNNWTTENNSTGGTPSNAAWTLRPDGYTYNSETFHSNDNSQFYLTNSHAQGGGWGTSTSTVLRSPATNTVGYTTLQLEFWHYYEDRWTWGFSGDYAYVEVSTDGTTWVNPPLSTYNSDQGSSDGFSHETINLSAYINSPTLYIRFRYYATSDYYWAVDNVTISGTSPSAACSWTSIPPGFTSTQNNPQNVSQTETTSYIVTYVDTLTNCPGTDTVTVSLAPVADPTIEANYCIIPGNVVLTAYPSGHTYLWNTGETTQSIEVDEVGIYSVTITNSYGCTATAFLNVANEYVTNGDFESGNVGFSTDYGYRADDPGINTELLIGGPGGNGEGLYGVGVSGQNYHPNFWGYDHTSGSGNFMLINGWGNSYTIWEQGPFTILANTDYYFSAWALSLNNVGPYAELRFEIETPEYGAVQVGTTANLSSGINSNNNPWNPEDRFYGSWNSGNATSATIRIINLEPSLNGNDFGLDDISFGTLTPVPATVNLSANGSACEGDTLYLQANLEGGLSPVEYNWTGPAGFTSTLENPSIPDVTLGYEGWYYLSVTDGYGCPPFEDSLFVDITPSPIATTSPSDTVCVGDPEPQVTFTASNGSQPYTFTYKLNGGPEQDTTTSSGNSISFSIPTNQPKTYSYELLWVTDINGCDRAVGDTCIITVSEIPACQITGDTIVCPNTTGIIYTGPEDISNYIWNITGNGTIQDPVNSRQVTIISGPDCNNPFTLILSVMNEMECASECSMVVMVGDDEPPTWTTPPGNLDRTFPCSDIPGISGAQELAPVAEDNCEGLVNVEKNAGPFVPGECILSGTFTNTFIATDTCGNISNIYTQVIIVVDTSGPVWTTAVNALNVSLDCDDTTGLAAAQSMVPDAIDNCDTDPEIVKIPGPFNPGACNNSGTYTNTFIAFDTCGNTSTDFIQVISVFDNNAPEITCPGNISIDCDIPVNPANTGMAIASDNCDSVPAITYDDIINPGSCPHSYSIQRTWTATDDCGNSSSCIQVISVQDISPPVLVGIPGDTVVSCEEIPLPASVTATDNCDLSVPVTFSEINNAPYGCGTIVRTWSAVDDCGNTADSTQIITVSDTLSPLLIGVPEDDTVSCESVPPPANVTAMDNCDPSVPVIYNEEVNTVEDGCGEIIRSWIATDYCGNSIADSQILTVEDHESPYWLTVPGALDVSLVCDDTTGLSIAQSFQPAAIDNCDTDLEIVKDTGEFVPSACPQTGTYTNSWIATDHCGNISDEYTQVISIIDNIPPLWDQPANFLDRNLVCTDTAGLAAALQLSPSATDNCSPGVLVELVEDEVISGGCPGSFTRIRRWAATDECGNTTSILYEQLIWITDDVPPLWDQSPGELDTIVICDDPGGLNAALILEPTATDACDTIALVTLISDEIIPEGCPGSYSRIRTWSAADNCGNINPELYQQLISVIDTVVPDFYNIPADVTISCEDPLPDIPGDIVAFDNCSFDVTGNITFIQGSLQQNPGCPNGGTITRTWTVDDGCGNVADTSQVITVEDDTPPLITCPDSVVVMADPGETFATLTLNEPIYSDNCSIEDSILITWVMTGATSTNGTGIIPEPFQFNVGTTSITYTATDECGNNSTCQFTVQVEPNDPPVIACPDSVYIPTDINQCLATVVPSDPWLTFGSEPVTWRWEMTGATVSSGTGKPIVPIPFTFNHGITVITWIATNVSGSDTCQQIISVYDDQPPQFDSPGPLEFCVNNIINATYNGQPEPGADIVPDRPDWYIIDGTTELDIYNLTDNCCPEDSLSISWTIDFSNGYPSLNGTGQPSLYGPITLWGTTDYTQVVHTITYSVRDCNDNSAEPVTVNITIKPRPDVIKLY